MEAVCNVTNEHRFILPTKPFEFANLSIRQVEHNSSPRFLIRMYVPFNMATMTNRSRGNGKDEL